MIRRPAARMAGWRLVVLLAGLALVVAGIVFEASADRTPVPTAQPTPNPTPPDVNSDPRATALLTTAVDAARDLAYQGTQYVSAWNAGDAESLVMRVEHVPGHGSLVQVQGAGNDKGGSVFQRDDETELPELGAASGPSLVGGPIALLERNYSLRVDPADAATPPSQTRVSAVRPGGSLAARFWIDRASGLIVRREVYDNAGKLTGATAFVDLDVGHVRTVTSLPPAQPEPWARISVDQLRRNGWRCPEVLAHGLVLYDSRSRVDDGGRVVHLSYSDGLAAVSLFAQHGRLDTDGLTGYTRQVVGGSIVYVDQTLPVRAVWAGGDTVYTLVADAPMGTVHDVVAELPHTERDRGGLSRLTHGLARVGSWLNPFG